MRAAVPTQPRLARGGSLRLASHDKSLASQA